MIAGAMLQVSLSDAPPTSAIASAAKWVSDLFFGPLATVIAVVAIAWIGFVMLSGRLDIRRGLSALLGCFLLFGARGIADGLRSSAVSDGIPTASAVPPPPAYPAAAPAAANRANAFDPYAGAAVMRPGQ